ncbi:hypothetical protein TcBrA4_0061630 [Trypanosoma cruzi]|nr:hypothetical protein TcBrA4_0061630 [Trypanosoma cruzi]
MNPALPHSYLSIAWRRDRVPAVLQFCSMVVSGVAGSVGQRSIEHSANSLARLLSEYGSVTRVCNWLVVLLELSPAGVRRTMRTSPGFFTGIARIVTTIFLGLFLASEEVELLAAGGVLSKVWRPHAARMVPIFFFYYNLLKAGTSAALLQAMQRISFEATDTQSVIRKRHYKELFLSFMEGIAFMVYAMTLLPSNAPRLREALNEGLWMDRVYSVFSSLCPQAVQVRPATQGLLGLLATAPFLLLSY